MEQASERKYLEQTGKGLRLCAVELEDASSSGHRGGQWSWPGSGTSWDCGGGACVPRLRGQQLLGSIQFLPSGSGARLPPSSEITREIRIVDVHMKFRNC